MIVPVPSPNSTGLKEDLGVDDRTDHPSDDDEAEDDESDALREGTFRHGVDPTGVQDRPPGSTEFLAEQEIQLGEVECDETLWRCQLPAVDGDDQRVHVARTDPARRAGADNVTDSGNIGAGVAAERRNGRLTGGVA